MSLYERCRFIVVSEELAVSDWARDIDRQTERHLVYTTQFVFIIQFVFFVFWQIVAHFNDSSLSLLLLFVLSVVETQCQEHVSLLKPLSVLRM